MKMKKIEIYLAAVLLLTACGGKGKNDLISKSWKQIEQYPDSALVLLKKIDTASLSENDHADYCLLMTMVDVKKHHENIVNDSVISECVGYYDRHGDRWHRAMAYHYQGVVKYALKNIPEAIKDLKKSETLAETLDDELLRNKIYERLAYANYAIDNKPEVLRYSQKLLDSSRKMCDSMMIGRSCAMVAAGFDRIGKKDSAYAYVMKSLDYIDALDPQTQSDIIFNVAVYYQEIGNMDKAEQYITDWVVHNSSDNFYLTLARIRKEQGKMEEAVNCALRASEIKEPHLRIDAMNLLADLYSEQGDSSRAYAIKKRIDEFSDSLELANKAGEMALWQMNFDEQQLKRASSKKLRIVMGGGIFMLSVIAVGWWWHRRKIERIEATGEQSSRQIEKLKRQVAERHDQLSARLHVGTKLYDRLRQGESIADATGKDLQCLVEYFTLLRPMQWYQWEQRYHALTPKQVAFLILQDELHRSDGQIAHALGISEGTVRVVRSRIKGREKA